MLSFRRRLFGLQKQKLFPYCQVYHFYKKKYIFKNIIIERNGVMPAKNQEKYIQQTEKFFAKIQQDAVQLISVTFSGALTEMNENQHVTQNMIPVPQGQVCQKIKCKPKNSFFFCEFFTEKQVFHKNLQKEDVVYLIRSL